MDLLQNRHYKGFIIFYRDIPEWLLKDHAAFILLCAIALRARRLPEEVYYNHEVIRLEPRHAIIGRITTSKEIGLSESEFRTAHKHLLKSHLISDVKVTNRFTIVSLDSDDIFDINIPADSSSKYPTNSQLFATINNENKDKNEKKTEDIDKSMSSYSLHSKEYFRDVALECIGYFEKIHQEIHGFPYSVDIDDSFDAMLKLVRLYEPEKLKKYIYKFMISPDEYIQKKGGKKIEVFYDQLQRLITIEFGIKEEII